MYCLVLVMICCLAGSWALAGDLELSAAVAKNEVGLGENLDLVFKVKNNGDKPTKVKELKFGRGSLELAVTMDQGLKFTYTRINGGPYETEPIKDVELPAGGELEAKVALPALAGGPVRIVGKLWGKLETPAVEATVTGGGSLGLRFETDAGIMDAKLLPEIAANTVANIAALVNQGYYDNLIFHRIIKGFMIQGGCPRGDGTGGPGFSLPAEFNSHHHARGVLSMARSQHRDSAGSQFFVMHGDAPHLDNQYTAFGELTDGLDVLDKLANWKVRGDQAVNPPHIKKMSLFAGK